jgi:hypothetical protein
LIEHVLKKEKQANRVDHRRTLVVMNNLTNPYNDVGRTAEATQLFEDVMKGERRVLRDGDPLRLMKMHNIALIYEDIGRRAEAIELEKEALAQRRSVLGDGQPCIENPERWIWQPHSRLKSRTLNRGCRISCKSPAAKTNSSNLLSE